VIGVLPNIEEPDTAFLSDLTEKRPAVRSEQERHRELTPWPTGRLLIGCRRIAAAIALGLLDRTRHILSSAFGFHNGHRSQANEQHIVRRSTGSWPFCDRQVAPFDRSDASRVSQRQCVRFPASLAKLFVNDPACLGLVELHILSFVLRQSGHCRSLLVGRRDHLSLEFGEVELKPLSFLFELLFGFSRKF
jgi:hypothetical protein